MARLPWDLVVDGRAPLASNTRVQLELLDRHRKAKGTEVIQADRQRVDGVIGGPAMNKGMGGTGRIKALLAHCER